jgi:galactosamine-6-phosphate isomerase
VLIDEWGGLPPGHPATCKEDVSAKLAKPLRIPPSRFVAFDTAAPDPAVECRRIAEVLGRQGPIDLCILGLGTNGHVGMNEPGREVEPRAHVAKLAPATLRHPMLKTAPTRPLYGLTLGMGDILNSRQILLLVSGEHKKQALARLREPRVTTSFPASLLWLHDDASVLFDAASGGTTPK